ncbi:hypothetical protein [Algoriphagus persicinus]|uniref:hypothetical protein n=1 Tax=Algoriphagus persicinus TaxID=3108754 RepID=UPI002B3DB301|nr:hypothetical protein [Algoriphagus sp. E1-3-M2]MEB2786889.1 hypothetical protein [Algoriphagus sp. E1-3-M2]
MTFFCSCAPSHEKEIKRAKGAMLTADFRRAQSILDRIPANSENKHEADSLYIVAGKAQIFLDSAQNARRILAPATDEIKPEVDSGGTKESEIGLWKTPTIYGGGSVRLFKVGNDYFKTESYPDGTSFTHKMSLTKQGENRVFKSLEKVSSDTWVVNQGEKLSIVDKLGLVYSVD